MNDAPKVISPALVREIHPEKNDQDITFLSQMHAGSHTKIWWLGSCGHEWAAQVRHRTEGGGCPFCAGQKVLAGFNDFQHLHPILSQEWDHDKNLLLPTEVTAGSAKKVWWSGTCGHSWEAAVKTRVAGRGCPVCSNLLKVEGVNTFAVRHPLLAAEWDSEKNRLDVTSPLIKSTLKAWWVCSEGHSWQAYIDVRIGGAGCHMCAKKLSGETRRLPKPGNSVADKFPHLVAEWHPTLNDLGPGEVNSGSNTMIYWECSRHHVWKTLVSIRTKGCNCPQCVSFTSKPEKEISEFLSVLGFDVESNTRKVISPYEVDIYVPEKKVGIEFNGVYWHTESAGKDKSYHRDKWFKAKEAGVHLIQIWEDDWNRNPELVKRILAHKLGVSQQKKVHARKTAVVSLDKETSDKFLDENHIQGAANGSIRVGLSFDNTLVAVMVMKKEPGVGSTLNLMRYSTSANVMGGFTKLLRAVLKENPNFNEVVTFSDNTISDGGLYRNNGFVAEKELAADYMYVVKGRRVHKFNYRIARFRDDPDLLWEEGLTETELAALNNIPRIWDAGKVKWKYSVTNV